jgi:carbon storage regulator
VLSRRRNEEIVIDHPCGPVRVRLVEIRGDKCRLGIVADKSIACHRAEVWDAIHAKNDGEAT